MITQNSQTLRNISLDFTGTLEELNSLFSLLEFELKSHPGQKGVGLSGIQINVPIRVAIIRHEKTAINLYNAVITKQEQPFIFQGEGCLSRPGIFANTKRYNLVEILNGDGEIIKLSGFLAVVAQHEIEHFSGSDFLDKQG